MNDGMKLAPVLLPMFAAFAISGISGKYVIRMLLRMNARQEERTEGLESHRKKAGTPNMGGIMFLGGFLIICAVCAARAPQVIPVAILTVGFGLVGFADDLIKVRKRRNLGLKAWQKIVLQLLVALCYTVYILYVHGIPLSMKVPFVPGMTLDFGIFNIPILLFIALGTVNATNLTDGVDGLASSVTVLVALFFTATAVLSGSGAAPAGAAMAGALLGFLLYNCHPAQVFMGDTGSLALGGFVVGMAYMLRMPLFIPIVGLIYVAEAVSVILQVGYFRLTHGRRIFRMAPIHHHFEKGGWSETKVVTVFSIITLLLCAAGLLGYWQG